MRFVQRLFSFDDNMVLEEQLDMLTYVQVCRTIYKNSMY